MINGYFHKEMIYHGKTIIIDACQLESGYIEVMTMYQGGKEIESTKVDNIDDAEKVFNGMRYKYEYQEEAELKGRYAKLRDDLINAVKAGKEADFGEDGGTCNFDAPSISMPRAREKLVKQAAKEAGISCFKWNTYGDTRWIFSTPTNAQANRNCRVSKAMCDVLTDAGWDCIEYASMD